MDFCVTVKWIIWPEVAVWTVPPSSSSSLQSIWHLIGWDRPCVTSWPDMTPLSSFITKLTRLAHWRGAQVEHGGAPERTEHQFNSFQDTLISCNDRGPLGLQPNSQKIVYSFPWWPCDDDSCGCVVTSVARAGSKSSAAFCVRTRMSMWKQEVGSARSSNIAVFICAIVSVLLLHLHHYKATVSSLSAPCHLSSSSRPFSCHCNISPRVHISTQRLSCLSACACTCVRAALTAGIDRSACGASCHVEKGNTDSERDSVEDWRENVHVW